MFDSLFNLIAKHSRAIMIGGAVAGAIGGAAATAATYVASCDIAAAKALECHNIVETKIEDKSSEQ